MLRDHFFPSTVKADRWFRWRGASILRIEALADGVFALALAFLITSIPVPNTYVELMKGLRQLPALAICFAMLWLLWHSHHLFFRRYALEDKGTIALNAVFLFLVLAFVHPLRFLASFLLNMFSGGVLSPPPAGPYVGQGEGLWLMPFYSAGAAAVFGLLWAMYRRAWSLRDELKLDEIERQLTRESMGEHAINTGIACASLAIALVNPGWMDVAGWIYASMGPLHAIHGRASGQRLRAIVDRISAEASATDQTTAPTQA